MSDERDREDALSDVWNALIRGERHASEADLRLEDVEVVHRLQRAGAAPFAGPSAEEAWPRVLARIEASGMIKEDPLMLANTAEFVSPILFLNGRTPQDMLPARTIAPASLSRRWAWGRWRRRRFSC
jgi:hypothetical protein